MGTRVVDRLEDWASRSFTDGHNGLQDLAADSFSGVVAAGGSELYMIHGTAVGIRRGELADFEDASGTVHEAPTPALPLLALMQEADVDVRAEYYSEETPMREVDGTLSEGGFTGYVELSENVLSGDYYLVYHDGKRMAVGFVGNNRRLITDEEAFETADDEVGIYRVYQVNIEPIDLPGTGGAAAGGAGAAAGGTTAAADSEETADDSAAAAGESASETADSATTAAGDRSEVSVASSDPVAEDSTVDRSETDEAGGDPAEEREGGAAESASADDADGSAGPGADGEREPADAPERDGDAAASGRSSDASTSPADLETRSIPSIDPARTQASHAGAAGVESPSQDRSRRARHADRNEAADASDTGRERPQRSQGSASAGDSTEGAADRSASDPSDAPAGGPSSPTVAELETALADREETIEGLERELSQARAERDDLAEQLEAVRAERDDLAARAEQLQESGTATAGASESGRDGDRLTPAEAMAGTDIFVRYRSKENATLRKAHDGSVRREDVTDNLRLETHTQFDAGTVSVDGQGFREFLGTRPEYQFIHWLVHDLLFEIRNTGHAQALSVLFDALPEIDRAQFDGTIETVYSDDGQETRSEEHFDIVLRDRMGDPLIVANLNDSREGATQTMMTDLITSAERLGQTSEELAGAFLVTRSFFEPPALETASEATRSGMFSRDKRHSFVNISRKRGFHLCLVEARNENFHLAVPEL